MKVFLDTIQSIWDQEKMPEDFHNALIVALYKNKGSKADCGNCLPFCQQQVKSLLVSS